jgi:protocatechuate 3,4-dioxygenase beta subunit
MSENKENRRKFLTKAGMLTGALFGAKAMGAACKQSIAQTKGPFPPLHVDNTRSGNPGPKISIQDRDVDLTSVQGRANSALGQYIILKGRVVDENCKPVTGAAVHLWQADNDGNYNHMRDVRPNPITLDLDFQYSGIAHTDSKGEFEFKTIVPKYYPIAFDANDRPTVFRTAHLHFSVKQIGYRTLVTQSYFEGDILDEIDEIRRLNKTDIILTESTALGGRRIRKELKPLIVKFKKDVAAGLPIGNLELTLSRLV